MQNPNPMLSHFWDTTVKMIYSCGEKWGDYTGKNLHFAFSSKFHIKTALNWSCYTVWLKFYSEKMSGICAIDGQSSWKNELKICTLK